jgi:hypothetical protein
MKGALNVGFLHSLSMQLKEKEKGINLFNLFLSKGNMRRNLLSILPENLNSFWLKSFSKKLHFRRRVFLSIQVIHTCFLFRIVQRT